MMLYSVSRRPAIDKPRLGLPLFALQSMPHVAFDHPASSASRIWIPYIKSSEVALSGRCSTSRWASYSILVDGTV